MLSTLHEPSGAAPVSADLIDFLVSRTPDQRLGITLIDADHLINENANELAASCLTEQERRQLATYTFEKRRQQWLLGRVCAKQSVLKLIDLTDDSQQLTPLDIAIGAAANGRPFIDPAATIFLQPIPDISISHSERKIIALAADGYCGIDIQVLTDTLFRVKSRFCSDKESTLLNSAGDDELTQLGLLWVAKEALRKCFGNFKTIGFLAMELSEIRRDESCSFLDLQLDCRCAGVDAVTVAASVEEDYCLGACIVQKGTDHA